MVLAIRCNAVPASRLAVLGIRWYARGAYQTQVDKIGGKPQDKQSRQQKIDNINMSTQSKLYRIDKEFSIFNKDVKKVLDLGYVPGNWCNYTKFRLEQIHGLNEANFNDNCHILGFDLLFGTPPIGVSTIQGNIYSKFSHKNIINHFKEIALNEYERQRSKTSQTEEFNNSYYVKEVSETVVEDDDLDKLSVNLNNMSLIDLPDHQKLMYKQRQQDILAELSYKPDLVLSDLCKPFMQQFGFFNNTNSRPYLRFNSNNALNKPITDPLKSSIDLNEAALLLCCEVLKTGGTFVTRISPVDYNDPELALFEKRLRQVFKRVEKQNGTKFDIGNEIFFIARDKKKDDDYSIADLFGIQNQKSEPPSSHL